MISKEMVQSWIEQTIEEGRTPADIERLAWLYIVHDHMGQEYSGAAGKGEDAQKLTEHDAKAWVEAMEGTDPERKRGGRWTMEEVKNIAKKSGWVLDGQKLIDAYAIVNAMYSDYYAVAQKYGLVAPEFFADLARAWIDDKDAKEGKAGLYWRYIVKR